VTTGIPPGAVAAPAEIDRIPLRDVLARPTSAGGPVFIYRLSHGLRRREFSLQHSECWQDIGGSTSHSAINHEHLTQGPLR